MLCNNTRRTHCCITTATLLMSICHSVAVYVHCMSWSSEKHIAVTILKILHITIKFSCLDNRAPEICAPLHDIKRQAQHFFLAIPTPFGRVSGSHVCCLLDATSFGCGSVLEYAWLVPSDDTVHNVWFCSVSFKAFRFWLFYLGLWVRT